MKRIFFLMMAVIALTMPGCRNTTVNSGTPHDKYMEVQKKLKTGWGTFNNRNVLSHVLLPHGFAMNIGIKTHSMGAENYLSESIISSRGMSRATIRPGYKSLDGRYSELTVDWNGMVFRVESTETDNRDLLLLVTPLKLGDSIPSVVLESGILWNFPGTLQHKDGKIIFTSGKKSVTVRTTGTTVKEHLPLSSPYLAVKLDGPVSFYTGNVLDIDQITSIIASARAGQETHYNKYGSQSDIYQAVESAIGWNIIYDASHDRVIFPVSRIWTETFGGQYVLFDWDTYFGAAMAGLESRELAYANAIEITKSITPQGFIPNFAGSYGMGSFDRSQPPVGSMVFRELYRKYKEKWLIEYVFDDLMTWNRWWPENRDNQGLLLLGLKPCRASVPFGFCHKCMAGAAYESGLDNSPMFDNVPFNTDTHMMEQADAGLMGLYVMDCDALAELAAEIGRSAEAEELVQRADLYRKNLSVLWDEKSGIYRNKRTDTGEFSEHISPTNFYPLLAKAPSQQQAERMIKEHLLNPEEFYGEWMIPSISRNDTAFKSQNYWRGRIWGPMNYLVYMGLRNYEFPEARRILAEKSASLMMENVKLNGYIYENYNAITGNYKNLEEASYRGDKYYHWGALLGFIRLLEEGY